MIAFGDAIERQCVAWSTVPALDERLGARQHSAREFLRLFGWSSPEVWSSPDLPDSDHSVSFRWHDVDAPSIVAHFVPNGALEHPASLDKRGLDLDQRTAQVVSAVNRQGIHYAFVTDMQVFYLYDARTGSLLLTADSPLTFVREFDDLLVDEQLRAGSLSDVRRQPRSFVARQLRVWQERCWEMLHTEWRVDDASAHLAIDRLLVLRYALDAGVLDRPGWEVAAPFAVLVSPYCQRPINGCGRAFVELCGAAGKHWRAGIFDPVPALESVLEQDAVAETLLRECGLLSRAKFDPATVLESFNFGEAAEKARVRMIPEENEERLEYLAAQTLDTIDDARVEIDLDDEGYRSITHWLDHLLECYARVSATASAANVVESHTDDMDLFDWSAMNDSQPAAVRDPWTYAFEHGLAIRFSTERQFRTARLLLYLYVVDRYAESGIRLNGFPPIEGAFVSRTVARRATSTDTPAAIRDAL